MAHGDPYADIDFDEITEGTGLATDEIKCLKVNSPFLFLFLSQILIDLSKFPFLQICCDLFDVKNHESVRKMAELTIKHCNHALGPVWTKLSNTVHTVHNLPAVCTPC